MTTLLTIHLAKRAAWSKKETARFPPVSQSRLEPQPPPPAFDKALRMNVYLLTRWKRFPSGLEDAAVTSPDEELATVCRRHNPRGG